MTCSNEIRTIKTGQKDKVDVTTKRLMKQRRELEMERSKLTRDIESIDRALTLAGIKPDKDTGAWMMEADYAVRQIFKDMRLKDACLKILQDLPKVWFTKAQIEYMLVRGGCEFATEASKNSVDVTMRRLADQGLCMAERTRGSEGNRYKANEAEQEERDDEVEDSRATNGKT